MSQKNTLRQIKNILYRLKRAYGLVATLYQPDETTPDYKTGILIRTWTTTSISKVIVLPYREQRKFEYDLSYLKAAVNFTYGGYYDVKRRHIIIDRGDLTTEITNNDYISFNNKRWEVQEVNMMEDDQVYMLLVALTDSADAPG